MNELEKNSKNQIRVILVVFLFGMTLFAMGLGLVTNEGFNFYGIIGLGLVSVGVLLLALGIHSLKNPIGFDPEY